MQTVTEIYSSEYRIKGSKFLAFLCPAQDELETEKCLKSIKNEHPAATHHCYAYLLNPNEPIEFSSDDGEPGGTAGLPILNALKSNELINVISIVVRYYGGTKLGKAGLIDAYQTTALQTIQSSSLKKIIPIKTYYLKYRYSQQSLINMWKNRFNWIELDSSYLEHVELTIGCPLKDSAKFETTVSANKHKLIEFDMKEKSFHI